METLKKIYLKPIIKNNNFTKLLVHFKYGLEF